MLVFIRRRPILDVTAAGVQKGWMRLRDGDDVRAHVAGDGLDVARHRRGIRDGHLLRVDLALGCLIDHRGQEMSAIGEMVRGRHPGQRISGDGVAVPVEQRLAQFAALVFGMRRLVHVDVGDRTDDTD